MEGPEDEVLTPSQENQENSPSFHTQEGDSAVLHPPGVVSIDDNHMDVDGAESKDEAVADEVTSTATEAVAAAPTPDPPVNADKPVTVFRTVWGESRAEADARRYREGYPGDRNADSSSDANVRFYRGEIKSRPDGDKIDNIHELWADDFELLEYHHGYIQWLFPIREHGLNDLAQKLYLSEIEVMKNDDKIKERLLNSYAMMLRFYGFQLVDRTTGAVALLEDETLRRQRLSNLNNRSHNFLRITRILKCLGELGFESFKKYWLEALIQEALETRKLSKAARSCKEYWIATLKDDTERERLLKYFDDRSK
eukprot:TRINITY_DN4344_c0_g1_i1.p1 TRINITY_DN4344_c0_g1~~TRINITY_DN4344_c0_g1_i1.p1  ORF type:complete len:325 (-),score=76.58 TRINITY_DN4344_c0_g1_i1:70-1002(-)